MYNEYEYLTQKQIGEHFGVSSHQIGRWLVKVGLREDKWPTDRAKWDGFARKIEANGKTFFAWHREQTICELERFGYRRLAQELDGPAEQKHEFGLIPKEDGSFEVVGPTDKLAIRATEKQAAEEIVKILNLAAKHGKLTSLAL